jgi:GNAT superfamily N-acetyltransferase
MNVTEGTTREVSGVGQARWAEVSAALAGAFYDDPVFAWLLPNAGRRMVALKRFFAIEARRIVLRHELSVAGQERDDLVGVALVLPPGGWRTPVRVQAAYGPEYVRVFGPRLPRALGVLTQMERRHPRHAHYYLPYIGVVAAAQGQGLGTSMLRPVLDRCDDEGLPAYLEASNPRCARLYERVGFRPIEEIRPLGAPPIRLMERTPS